MRSGSMFRMLAVWMSVSIAPLYATVGVPPSGDMSSPRPTPVFDGGPFSTPETTALSFFHAAAAKDPGMLAKCFSQKAEKELQDIVKQRLTDEQLEDLRISFEEAAITSVEPADDPSRATVHIQYRKRGAEVEEHLEMVKEGDEWKILGF